eukprot:3433045-Rhodomonas_salina.1
MEMERQTAGCAGSAAPLLLSSASPRANQPPQPATERGSPARTSTWSLRQGSPATSVCPRLDSGLCVECACIPTPSSAPPSTSQLGPPNPTSESPVELAQRCSATTLPVLCYYDCPSRASRHSSTRRITRIQFFHRPHILRRISHAALCPCLCAMLASASLSGLTQGIASVFSPAAAQLMTLSAGRCA